MTEPSHCVLQVLRVTDILTNKKDAKFYMTIKLGESTRKTGEINDEGKPNWNDMVTFSQSDTSTICSISLKSPRFAKDGLVGRADVAVAQLQGSVEHEVRLNLQSSSRMGFGRPEPEYTATVMLSYKEIDALSRARIDVDAAEQSVERMKNSGEKSESAIAAIGYVKEAVDTVVEIIDKVAEIHPLFHVSWKAASALYKLVSHQYEKDVRLVGMVEQMKDAHNFSTVAKELKDDGNVIEPKLRELLDETARCSEFVRTYVKHRFALRMVRLSDRERMDEFSGRFIDLRKELDSRIGATAARVADEIKQQQTLDAQVISETRNVAIDISLIQQLEFLEKQLNPLKSDVSDVSKRPRCLEGTREEYLSPIMEFLTSDGTPNILWLSGAAGSGKSTIAVTASDRCDKKGCSAAYLVFEREKSEPGSVIRTLAYRLATLHPSFASHLSVACGKNKNTNGSTLRTQFEVLLLEPLNALEHEERARTVIILDALDECGGMDQREDFLSLLKNEFAQPPTNVRILITSRPENDITKALLPGGHIRHDLLEHESDQSQWDVSRYIRETMSRLVGEPVVNEGGWNDKMQILCDAAGGLFIWASTAVKMVKKCEVRWEQLDALLEDIRSVGEYGIDGLYATALMDCGIMWRSPKSRDRFARVVGLVMLAKEELSALVIAGVLGLGEDSVDITLGHLQPVVSYRPGHPVHLHHASFADYILSDERSGGQSWHIDATGQRLAIAERCLDIMMDMLRFNICDIESSFVVNKDIPDLQERIQKNVPPHLDYACRFWATHVCELPHSTDLTSLLAKLKTFAATHLLYWFEVLSLTGNYNRVAVRGLYEVSLWAAPIDPNLSSFIWAAYRLASVFSFPISQSAPQVYLSAVSLWRGESRVADHYSRRHPCVPIQRSGTKPPAQCIKIIRGHKYGITSVAFSQDGKRIVSGPHDKTVCIWDADTGELVLGPLKEYSDDVISVAVSRDGKFVASGSVDQTIRIWNAVTGELVSGLLEGHSDIVNSVAFSPDGTRLASGSWDGTVRIWDVNTGKLVSGPFEGQTGAVNSIGFSPDGSRVVSGSDDGTTRIWNIDSGDAIAFEGRTRVTSVAFSPDGGRIVSGSADKMVRVWNAETGQLVSSPFEGHTDGVRSVALSPDGNLVVSGSDDYTVRIWDSKTGKLISGPFEGHASGVSSVAFSPDGKRAVSGSYDCTIRIWDVESGTNLSSPLNRHESQVCSVGFSADGKRAVSGFANGKIRVWDTDSGKLVSDAFEGHTDPVCPVALSADGTLVVSGSNDKTVRVWNADSGELVSGPPKSHTDWVRSVAFSRDGKRVVSASDDNTIRIWNAANGELVSGPLEGHTDWVSSVAFSPDGILVVSGSHDGTLRVWNAASGAPISRPFQEHESYVMSVAFSLNGENIVSGSADGMIRIWDVATGEVVLGPLEGHTNRINSVTFSSDGNRVVSGSDDKTIRVWGAVSGGLISTFYGHGEGVLAVAFSPDGSCIDSGSEDGTIRTWYVGDGEVMHEHVLKHSGRSSSVIVGTALNGDRVAEVPSSDLTKRRGITDWRMTEDGWIVTGKGELLTWIPEDMRTSLWQGRNTAFFGWRFVTRLDFSDAPVGEGWYLGFPQPD